jgi:hypothetical protein
MLPLLIDVNELPILNMLASMLMDHLLVSADLLLWCSNTAL